VLALRSLLTCDTTTTSSLGDDAAAVVVVVIVVVVDVPDVVVFALIVGTVTTANAVLLNSIIACSIYDIKHPTNHNVANAPERCQQSRRVSIM
jgi:hypothetical protein